MTAFPGTCPAAMPAMMSGPHKALVACLVAGAILCAIVGVGTVPYPYGVAYGEALAIDEAQRMTAGLPLYRSTLDAPPYVIDLYPPVYPLVVAVGGAVSHLPLLQVGRALSLVAALGSSLLVGLVAFRLAENRVAGIVAAGLFVVSPFVTAWAPLARVDMLALSLSLGALWILYRRWHSWPWLIAASLLVAGSILTRQTYALATPAAGAVWLWHCERRRAAVFVASIGCVCLLGFLLLNAASHGGFYLNTVVANLGPYEFARLVGFGGMLLAVSPIVLVVAGLEIARCLGPRRQQAGAADDGEAIPPFARYGLAPYTAGALLSALTVGKIGSDVNYLLELVAALSIWAGVALAWLPKRQPRGHQANTLLVMAQVVWALAIDAHGASKLAAYWIDLPRYDEVYRLVQVAANRGPVLADTSLEMVVRAGGGIYFEPFAFEQARRQGLWAPDGLIGEIKAHKFPLIVLDRSSKALYAERWSERITAAIRENYVGTKQVGGLITYTPRALRSSGVELSR